MKLEDAQRKRVKIKMGLQGPAGAGKTFSALLLAYGLCGDWSKIAVIDSENHSSELYSHLGKFKVLHINPPFTPERYMEAITICEDNAIEVIIIDSVTHEWENLLDFHTSLLGNSFTNWGKVTPRHNQFVQRLLHSPVHIICTIRTKQDYVLNEKNGKVVPEKVGLKSIQRDGLEYEFTLVFDLDMKNHAVASKDRTGLFFGRPEQRLTIEIGEQIKDWCNDGVEVTENDVVQRIGDCRSIKELLNIYLQHPQFKEKLQKDFEQRKRQLLISQEVSTLLNNPQNISLNGTH